MEETEDEPHPVRGTRDAICGVVFGNICGFICGGGIGGGGCPEGQVPLDYIFLNDAGMGTMFVNGTVGTITTSSGDTVRAIYFTQSI